MTNVKMYTKPGCPYCAAAKEHYTKNGVAFDETNVIGDDAAQAELLKLSGGKKIVPVIVDKGKIILGWNGG
jgi:glutaredoxin 3